MFVKKSEAFLKGYKTKKVKQDYILVKRERREGSVVCEDVK